MPYEVPLSSLRGDKLNLWVVLMRSVTPPVPFTQAEAQLLKDTYPSILLQVKSAATDTISKLELTSPTQVFIDTAYTLPNGLIRPVLRITAEGSLVSQVFDGVYDAEFSSATDGPYTWIFGNFSITQDVSRRA